MQAQILNPFIQPWSNAKPFDYSSADVVLSNGVETSLGNFTTGNRWLRINSYELMAQQAAGHRLRFFGNGCYDFGDFFPLASQNRCGNAVPIFILIPPRTRVDLSIVGGGASSHSVLRLTGWYFNIEDKGIQPTFRKFISPFMRTFNTIPNLTTRTRIVEYSGNRLGHLVFDCMKINYGTVGLNSFSLETDNEALLDYNGFYGSSEGGWNIPIYGECNAQKPFYIDFIPVLAQPLKFSIGGYIGGDFLPDEDGFFCPKLNSLSFIESAFAVSVSQNVRTLLFRNKVPAAKSARVYRLELMSSAGSSIDDYDFELYGDGLEEYRLLKSNGSPQPFDGGQSYAIYELIASVRPNTNIELFATKQTFGTTTLSASLYGWING